MALPMKNISGNSNISDHPRQPSNNTRNNMSDLEEQLVFDNEPDDQDTDSVNESESIRELIDTVMSLETTLTSLKKRIRLKADELDIEPEHYFHKPTKKPKIRPVLVNNLLVLTALWQTLNVGILSLMDDAVVDGQSVTTLDVGLGIMIFFQLLLLIFMIAISIKLAKQIKHRSVTTLFLARSYVSTCLLFAGIYTLIFRIDPKSFTGIFEHEVGERANNVPIFLLFVKFLYFSITTMTTVGYGDLIPRLWYSYLVVNIEMLVSVTYITVIFGRGLSYFSQPLLVPPKTKVTTFDSHFRTRSTGSPTWSLNSLRKKVTSNASSSSVSYERV
eukprot:TRINITY_DN3951_c0_g1_i3.p1 TRINITY_DN3951_c0_g1~~TRINITY_DN3951_c0_g1_i3.p1  ORF type:complete len:331 (+),score=44.17 TRINITY_DN3951_c0_g1_i3:242-1234(+)